MKKPGEITIKRWQINLSLFISLTLSFLLLSSVLSPTNAASPKKKLSKIKRELKKKKQRIKDTIKKEKSVLSRIDKIDRRIKKTRRELKSYDKQISRNKSRIAGLSKEIREVSKKLDKREKHLKDRLRTLYKHQYGGNALILFTAKDYQDLIRRSRYISLLAHSDKKVIDDFHTSLKISNFKKKNMEILHNKLEANKRSAKKKKSELENNKAKKGRLLATIRSKRSSYEKVVKELEASSKKIQEVIKKQAKKKVPKAVTGKGFRVNRGRLPWPLKGKVLVPFGKYKDPKFNIPVFKNGIEIKARVGDRPRAVAGGRVVYADWFKGYGLLLIINHGNGYHSLYGNLSEIFHKSGDIIRKGTTLGKIGESRILSVPTLYFEIRYKGKPVNPLRWLERRSRISKRK